MFIVFIIGLLGNSYAYLRSRKETHRWFVKIQETPWHFAGRKDWMNAKFPEEWVDCKNELATPSVTFATTRTYCSLHEHDPHHDQQLCRKGFFLECSWVLKKSALYSTQFLEVLIGMKNVYFWGVPFKFAKVVKSNQKSWCAKKNCKLVIRTTLLKIMGLIIRSVNGSSACTVVPLDGLPDMKFSR